MERLTSLINKLKLRHDEGCTPTEILLLLDEIRAELNSTVAVADHTRTSVSVWVPAGYSRSEKISPVDEAFQNTPVQLPKVETKTQVAHVFEFDTEGKAEEAIELPVSNENPPALLQSVLRPPVSIIEEDLPKINPEPVSEVPASEESSTVPFIHDVLLKAEMEKSPKEEESDNPEETEKPLVFELEIPEAEVNEPVFNQFGHRSPFEETEKFLSGSLVETEKVEKPKELHEILAARVVAKPENTPAVRRALGDTLGGGKINDLRKAIAINDRFRYIKSLFRGDETLFERSLKTINNFNILPEAQYWIQRELVIKLGWNDEDELVQQFYSLVSRRFL